ncbi:MAG: TIGR02147 family protein [Fibrobacteraceae bacterium]|nr:TIGR02147 family protein [Fibrobacteraceae bacterium]MEE1276487.1 TIGR02147 family protein [Fibrobacteraceae bacterium]
MNENKEQRKIFEYLDYREFLQDYYRIRKEANSSFSLRAFSDKIGFKAKDFISRVMQGEKNLSEQSIQKVASGLRLGKRESEFFAALVLFNQAETAEERNSHYAKMQEILKIVRFSESQHLMAHYQYQVYSDWRHLVVRSLIGMFGFSGDFKELGNRVHPKITPEQAKESVKLLESCGLISKKEDGSYELSQSAITTGNRTSKTALRGFHQKCLKLGADSIDRDQPSERNISGLTLGISKDGYERIVERINAFRKEIAFLAEEDQAADSAYQLEICFFKVGGKK